MKMPLYNLLHIQLSQCTLKTTSFAEQPRKFETFKVVFNWKLGETRRNFIQRVPF